MPSTLDGALAVQKQYNILQAPASSTTQTQNVKVAATASTLNITLENNTDSSNCYAYVTGLAVNKNNAVFLLQADGVTPYYPSSPSSTLQPLAVDCSIQLGAPGTSRAVTIPQLAGGRVWLCKDSELTFSINPGPALVEPSVTNTSDPNYNLYWSFAEFTYNSFELFANITFVDFVSMPIGLTLVNGSGEVQSVPGIHASGLDEVCSALQAQDAADGAGWSQLIVTDASTGANLRALSPNSGIVMHTGLFDGYYQPFVDAVWAKYQSDTLTVDTQGQWGTLEGQVVGGLLAFGSVGAFPQPSAADIFSCSSGAFGAYQTNGDEMGNITARLAAAFNRSTLLINPLQPDGELVSQYYQNAVTNHYARIVHATCPDGKGYAFPYDDVDASDATNVAGTVADSDPQTFTISFGGPSTSAATVRREKSSAAEHARSGGHARQQVGRSGGGRRIARRGLLFATAEEREPAPPQMVEMAARHDDDDDDVDLEAGLRRKLGGGVLPGTPPGRVALDGLLPAAVRSRLAPLLARIEDSPAYRRFARPAADAALAALAALLRLGVRSLVSRVAMVLLLLLGSFLLGAFGRPEVVGAVGLLGDA